MRSTNNWCEPYRYSPMATVASFALPTIMLLSKVSKGSVSPASSSTCEPPMPAAVWETGTGSSSVARPASNASNASKMAMTLVTLATGRRSSAVCSKRICPLSGSTSTALSHNSGIGGAVSSAASISSPRAAQGASSASANKRHANFLMLSTSHLILTRRGGRVCWHGANAARITWLCPKLR